MSVALWDQPVRAALSCISDGDVPAPRLTSVEHFDADGLELLADRVRLRASTRSAIDVCRVGDGRKPQAKFAAAFVPTTRRSPGTAHGPTMLAAHVKAAPGDVAEDKDELLYKENSRMASGGAVN